VDWIHRLRIQNVVGSGGQGNGLPGIIQGGDFLNKLSEHYVVKEDSTSGN